ncbi:MAG: hypothetical protein IPM35_27155 [Myxococcales bacterium]|nr:hypothetical protein [Myxococcales bacterium]
MGNPHDPTKPGDVPDLDLGPLVPRRAETAKPAAPAAPAPAPKPAAGGGAFDLFGGGFDEDHFGSGSGVSDLHGQTASSGAYDSGSMDLDDDEQPGGLGLELSSYRPPAPEGATAPPGAPTAPPTAPPPQRSLAPELPAVDASAAGLLARYGPAPSAIYLAPLYAFRVFTRQRELRADLARLNGEITAQERKLDEMFAGVASAARPALGSDARFEAVRQLESIAGERGAALSQTNEQFKAQNDQLEQQLAAVQAQLPPLDAEKQRATAAVAEREAELGRVVAKQKRFLIEARSVKMSALPAGSPPNTPLPADAAARIQALESQAAAVQPEVDQHKHALAEAQSALQTVRNHLGALGQHTRRIQDQQKALARQFQGQLSAANAGFSDAQRELTSALAEVGRGLVAQRDSLSLDPAALAAIGTGEANLRRLTESNALHLSALDAYDREAVKKGYLLVAGAVALVVISIVLAIVL